MTRESEYALIQERINLQKTKAKTNDKYKKLNSQVCLFIIFSISLKLFFLRLNY